MKKTDAFGEQLWSYYKTGEPQYDLIERDDGFIAIGVSGPRLYFSSYDEWDALDRRAIAYARGRVLDIGCAAGRHALHLQRNGYDVTGIDDSPLSIRVARLRGLKKARVLAIEGIGTFPRESFDTVLMLGNNFGLFGSLPKARRLLRQLQTITTGEATIIARALDLRHGADPIHRAYMARNRRRGRLPGQMRIRSRFRNVAGNWFDYLFVSKREMQTILKGTGWAVRRFIDGRRGAFVALLRRV
jgi:SAM-dependent methyltransferase